MFSHPAFASISNTLSVLEQYSDELPTTDLPFVELQLLEMHENLSNDLLRRSKLETAIEKLETIIDLVEEESEVVLNKLRWTR